MTNTFSAEAEVPQMICTITDRFLIRGRGLVVVTREPYKDPILPLRVGQAMELRRVSGEHHPVTVKGLEIGRFVTGSPDNRPHSFLIAAVAREQVGEGDTLWTVPTLNAPPTP